MAADAEKRRHEEMICATLASGVLARTGIGAASPVEVSRIYRDIRCEMFPESFDTFGYALVAKLVREVAGGLPAIRAAGLR